MVAVAIPATSIRLGISDYGTDPTTTTTTTHRAYELLAKGFGPGFSGPLQVVEVRTPAQEHTFTQVVAAAARTHGVAATTPPRSCWPQRASPPSPPRSSTPPAARRTSPPPTSSPRSATR